MISQLADIGMETKSHREYSSHKSAIAKDGWFSPPAKRNRSLKDQALFYGELVSRRLSFGSIWETGDSSFKGVMAQLCVQDC
jgi:hypothetical protein